MALTMQTPLSKVLGAKTATAMTDSLGLRTVRDWLTSPASGWDRSGSVPPPPLPDDVVALTRERYVEAFERLTGTPFS